MRQQNDAPTSITLPEETINRFPLFKHFLFTSFTVNRTTKSHLGFTMGLRDWFATFLSTIQIKNSETISTRYHTITKRLNIDFWGNDSDTYHSLYVGSYGRHTAVNGDSDVDMIFQLPYSWYVTYSNYTSNGQSSLLQSVRASLLKTYPNSALGADGQVIKISFADGLVFEVVPAFENTDYSFTHPDSNNGGSWKTTNPRPEIQAIRDRNSDANSNLIPLCRMMRAWKAEWNVPMGGLLIDTLAYQFMATWPQRDKSIFYYDWMSRDFFRFLADQDTDKRWWRAPGSAQWVYWRGNFQTKGEKCYRLALAAIEHETADPKREHAAKSKWRDIYGTNFPS